MFREVGMLASREDVREVEEALLSNARHRTRMTVPLERLSAKRLTHDGFSCLVATDLAITIEWLSCRPLCDFTRSNPACPDVWGIAVVVRLGSTV